MSHFNPLPASDTYEPKNISRRQMVLILYHCQKKLLNPLKCQLHNSKKCVTNHIILNLFLIRHTFDTLN